MSRENNQPSDAEQNAQPTEHHPAPQPEQTTLQPATEAAATEPIPAAEADLSATGSDALRGLSKKALRRLARQHKIKHFYRKSPASLRRALRRNMARSAAVGQQPAPSAAPGLTLPASKLPTKPLSAEERAEQRQREELKAYEEHRLRYLHTPSRFLHKATHEEFLLEKDEEIELPDFYQEDELVALPIDPYRFYVYWDFAEETLFDVRSWLAEDTPFVLRIHDVTSLVFNGRNAHHSWQVPCHPLVREWYLDAPVNGRNLLVELGVMLADGFWKVLSARPIFVPPASVSEVRLDRFGEFQPEQLRRQDLSKIELQPIQPESLTAPQRPETSAKAFFQEYVPTPVQFNPTPPPRQILNTEAAPPPLQPWTLPANLQPKERPVFFIPERQRPTPAQAPPEPAAPAPMAFELEHAPAPEPEWQMGVLPEPSEAETLAWIQQEGRRQIQTWLGLPQEIRWLSDLPAGMSPIFFEQWVTDPYDRAMMISYSIWPWEISEYIPLGASDEIMRRFLGASLFSWTTPGGSERMIWWQQPQGASERKRWLRPQGASEQSWSGALQPQRQQGLNPWYLWPAPVSGRGLGRDSGRGLSI